MFFLSGGRESKLKYLTKDSQSLLWDSELEILLGNEQPSKLFQENDQT
jgi:hypothetical protein